MERLLIKETLSGKEVAETLEGAGVIPFPDAYVEGFTWGQDGGLRYPGMPTQASNASCLSANMLLLICQVTGIGEHSQACGGCCILRASDLH